MQIARLTSQDGRVGRCGALFSMYAMCVSLFAQKMTEQNIVDRVPASLHSDKFMYPPKVEDNFGYAMPDFIVKK